jgi:SNF2 family DNA or RNA helicase
MTMLDSGLLVASSVLTQTIRLSQLASSYGEVVVNEAGEEKMLLSNPSSKISAFLEDLEDLEGRTIVVFAVSRQLIMLLSDHLDKLKIQHGLIVGGQSSGTRQEHIDNFQAGRTKIILVTIAAGGTGLTLTAADTMVFLQRSWSSVEMSQAAARAHRIGSEIHESILRIDYIAPGTIEEAVLDALEGKGAAMEEIVRDQELLRKVLMARG